MDIIYSFQQLPLGVILLIAFIAVWDIVWKLTAFWRSARNGDLAWFICIAIFNTAGILPIIYLLTHKGKDING